MHRITVRSMTLRVGIQVRISDDRDEDDLERGRRGVNRQEGDCRALATREGWTVVEVYAENDTSAFKRRKITLPNGRTAMRVIRPEFRRMLDDLESGHIQGLIAYDLDRVARDPRDLEDLIDAVETTTPRPSIRSVTGSLRLDNDGDVTNARVLVAMANKSSRDTARRVARAARERAEKGEYHGGQPAFGFEAVKEMDHGRERVVDLRPHPEQAAWVREAMARLLAGESLYGICVDFNAKGRRTGWMRRDHPDQPATRWFPRTLKRVVMAPAIAGYREHEGQLYDATWNPIVDRDDWRRLRTILLSRTDSNFTPGANHRKYMLSGIVHCTCGNVMVSMTASRLRGPSFVCSKLATNSGCGRMRISMAHLDAYVTAQVFTRLDSPEVLEAVGRQDIDEGAERELLDAIARDDRALDALADERDDGAITKAEYNRRRDRLSMRQEANRTALGRMTRTHAYVPPVDELRRVWPDRDNAWKRTILSAVIRRITIASHPRDTASNLTQRSTESGPDFSARRDLHTGLVMRRRVAVDWWR